MLSTWTVPFLLRLSNAIVSYWVYLRKMIWPMDLAIFYPFPSSIPFWKPVLGMAALIAVTGFFLYRARKSPYLITGWLWYLGTLMPVIGLVQGGLWPATADRWAYIPLIGIFIVIAWGVLSTGKSFSSSTARLMFSVLSIVILLLLWFQTGRELKYWENDETLFQHTAEVTENNFIAYQTLGIYYKISGNKTLAMQHFSRAYDIAPDDFGVLKDIGIFLSMDGEPERALRFLFKALEINPQDRDLPFAIGESYFRKGDLEKAIHYYVEALQKTPDRAFIWNNLGNAYFKMENIEQASYAYEKAISLDPDDPHGYFNLGILVGAQFGNSEEALRLYRTALAKDSDYANAHQKIAEILIKRNRFDEALPHCQEALRKAPEDAINHYNIGIAMALMGHTEEAVSYLKNALQLNPEYQQAQKVLDMLNSTNGSIR
jgi:protein O-mannosyl-transferase